MHATCALSGAACRSWKLDSSSMTRGIRALAHAVREGRAYVAADAGVHAAARYISPSIMTVLVLPLVPVTAMTGAALKYAPKTYLSEYGDVVQSGVRQHGMSLGYARAHYYEVALLHARRKPVRFHRHDARSRRVQAPLPRPFRSCRCPARARSCLQTSYKNIMTFMLGLCHEAANTSENSTTPAPRAR